MAAAREYLEGLRVSLCKGRRRKHADDSIAKAQHQIYVPWRHSRHSVLSLLLGEEV